jgi:hypothetical protein
MVLDPPGKPLRSRRTRAGSEDEGAVTEHHPRLRRDLLQELLFAYGPCGQEDAVRDVCRRELEPHVDEMWIDEAGNLARSRARRWQRCADDAGDGSP